MAELREKLKDYEDAEESGLLVRLPCKIGSKIYQISGKFILEYTVCFFNLDETGVCLIHGEYFFEEKERTYTNCFDVCEIGKTVFLTKAEAEAKLKEMEGENEVR